MSPEKDHYLVEKYPMLYRQRGLPMEQTAMCWGFEHGDGWFDLIDKLSQCLTEYAEANNMDIEATQVKEKFGTLRFYTSIRGAGSADEIWDMIDRADCLSGYICDVCGAPGDSKASRGWIATRCEEHR